MLKNLFVYLFTLVLPILVIVALFRGLFGFNAFDWSAFLHLIEQEFSSTHNSFEAVVDVFSGIFKVFSENMLSAPNVRVPDPSGNWISDIFNMLLGVFNSLIAIATLLLQLMMKITSF